MQGYFAIISLLLMMIMVIIRAKQLKKKGIKAFKFGELDKKDFFIIPFAVLFFYLIFSSVFDLIGTFLILPNWILLLYVFAGVWLFNRQVQLEEKSLKKIYGEEYEAYCKKVRKYL